MMDPVPPTTDVAAMQLESGAYPTKGLLPSTVGSSSGAASIHTLSTSQHVTTQMFLRPIAHPSCMGLAAFFASTWLLSTWYCAWYGSDKTPGGIFAFVAILGGLGQFLAGMQAFPARDDLATVVHVTWGSFFLSFGVMVLLELLTGVALLPLRTQESPELGMIFVTLAAITWICCIACFSRDFSTVCTMFLLATGSTLMFAGLFSGSTDCMKAAGYFLMLSSLTALYRTMAYLLEEGWGKLPAWYPVMKTPWEKTRPAITLPIDEPGVKKGQ